MDIQKIALDVKQVLEHSQNTDVSMAAVKDMIRQWAAAKQKFIELFDGELIYSTNSKVSFELDDDKKSKKVDEFCTTISETFPQYEDLYSFIAENKDSFFKNVLEKDYNVGPYHIKAGIKLSKAYKNFIDNEKDLDTIQTLMSQVLQENKITGYLCFSVHPLDYLSSSENNCNWRSCHALNGEYRAGNLSYMLDKSTIVCYISDWKREDLPRFPVSVPWNSKKWRMLLFISENWDAIFAGRQYPFFSKAIMEQIRLRWEQKTTTKSDLYWNEGWSHWHDDRIIIPEYREWNTDATYLRDNYIPIRKDIVGMKTLITDNSDLHFNDLLRSSCYIPYYAWKNKLFDTPHFSIGSKVKCVKCGRKYLYDSSCMFCEDCLEDSGYVRCSDCGEIIPVDEAFSVNGGDRVVCRSCFDNNYTACACCLESFHIDDMVWREDLDAYICPTCNENDNY